MAKCRILSFDGGGIRGIIPARLVERLSAIPSLVGWIDKVDLIAGTSTGGLIALGLAHGVPIADIRALYESKAKKIFDDSWLDDLVDLGRIAGADYDNKNLRKELRALFGEATLKQLGKKVLITAFDLDNEAGPGKVRTWKPKIFHNLPNSEPDDDALAYKIGLYTSAAPTYFPAVDGFVDGGVFAPNPSMCALAQALDTRLAAPWKLTDICLLSIGTGVSQVYVEGRSLDWGYAQWAKPLVGLMLDGVTGIADFQCRQLLGGRYHRLDLTFNRGKSFPLDGVKKVSEMRSLADNLDLTASEKWMGEFWL